MTDLNARLPTTAVRPFSVSSSEISSPAKFSPRTVTLVVIPALLAIALRGVEQKLILAAHGVPLSNERMVKATGSRM